MFTERNWFFVPIEQRKCTYVFVLCYVFSPILIFFCFRSIFRPFLFYFVYLYHVFWETLLRFSVTHIQKIGGFFIWIRIEDTYMRFILNELELEDWTMNRENMISTQQWNFTITPNCSNFFFWQFEIGNCFFFVS